MQNKNLINTIYMNYKLVELLGTGGMNSEVYLGKYVGNDKDIPEKYKNAAIKIITKTSDTTSDQWNKILDEAVTNARLSKKSDVNIVKLFNYDNTDTDVVKTVMEYMDGESLKIVLRDRSCFSLVETLYFFEKILIGIQYMHNQDRSIIHRDLKPENILTSSDLLEAKISDFGVCTVIEPNSKNNFLTNETSFFGTVPYVTPDAFNCTFSEGKRIPIITKQFDFHSLGIIFYEMLVGDKPFEIIDENDTSTIKLFADYDITPMKYINPSITNDVENVFLRLTASKENDKHLRYTCVEEIINDVKRIQNKYTKNDREDETLKPYYKRTYQSRLLLELKENFTLWRSICKNKWVLGCVVVFGLVTVLTIIFLLLDILW